MSGIKLEKIILKNFKCHKNFETDLKCLNIFTGSNATGKSSIVQSILLAFKSWEEVEKKQVNTNRVYGVNLGIPISVVSEDLQEQDVELILYPGNVKNCRRRLWKKCIHFNP